MPHSIGGTFARTHSFMSEDFAPLRSLSWRGLGHLTSA